MQSGYQEQSDHVYRLPAGILVSIPVEICYC